MVARQTSHRHGCEGSCRGRGSQAFSGRSEVRIPASAHDRNRALEPFPRTNSNIGNVRFAASGQVHSSQVADAAIRINEVSAMDGQLPASARCGPVMSERCGRFLLKLQWPGPLQLDELTLHLGPHVSGAQYLHCGPAQPLGSEYSPHLFLQHQQGFQRRPR